MTTDQFIVTISALVTGTLTAGWLLKAAYTGTEVDNRHRCEAHLSHGTCSRPGNRIEHVGGVHYLCTRHASDEGWGR